MATICDRIDSFELHVLTRQLNIGNILGDHFIKDAKNDELSQSAFVILSIGLAYFEMIEQFMSGQSSNHHSPEFFKKGFQRVYPSSCMNQNDLSMIYSQIRCGMFHIAMPKDRCGLDRNSPCAFTKDNKGAVVINPAILIDDLIVHFKDYCEKLRQGAPYCDFRQNFETMFDLLENNAPTKYMETGVSGTPWDV